MAITASAVLDFPKRRTACLLQRAAIFSALALLSACASHSPKLSATGQASGYANPASGSYAPPGPTSDPWGPYIRQASKRFDVPQRWIRQVMRVESGGHEYLGGHLTTSPTGAMGLMQLEPATYREMAAQYGLGSDPYNPYNNIMAGTAYIHEMYQIYGSPGFLAAYNAGPGRLDNYLDYHQPLPNATRQYVAMIAPRISGVYPAAQSSTGTPNVELAMNRLPATIPPGMRSSAGSSVTDQLNQQALAAAQQTRASQASSPAAVPAPIEVAALTPPPQIDQQSPVDAPPSAPPPIEHSGGFALIPSAEAATRLPYIPPQPVVTPPPLPRPVRPATMVIAPHPTGWAIQVGAYNSSSQAKAALGVAELSAVQMLIKGKPVVISVNTPRGRLYRARYIDLPQTAALNACERLRSAPTGCAVLSPAAQ
ncbi:MAG TPA: lytic transglycosylase domain-containing protein [Acidiphilium sp.]|nr:MAG: lytic transglycosylase [Acidiphilium sp. 21-60-14]OYV92470.1 MAG: lytic transglycosylase [Acidiphilium sp. 37-60-79]OZB40922.1 MAG: lytic transglycosylase [Acidiphilium sp. 34-60-192]HQT87898.1 lytic transglycosylase domain-containing protein [Acidiphilium sp.]HQU22669.1 lytic transglycosylase domain-containing protein [Acidiphilium sp.]